jgi:glutathione S-transferase
MADLTLVIGNKNYSSWSLRAWLGLVQVGVPFDEILIPLQQPGTRAEILKHSPSGTVPVLKRGAFAVWESIAILGYLGEAFPAAGLWPDTIEGRALAKSVCAEMHSGFHALRSELPMNVRSSFPHRKPSPRAQADIARITAIWRDCRSRAASGAEADADGPFLFGRFTAVDAMYAPVVSRFRTYAIDLDEVCRAYADAVWALPAMQAWAKDAANEPMVVESCEF